MTDTYPMNSVRPTLRCLRDDLKVAVPPATIPLDEIEHPLLAKAVLQFAEPKTRHERIRAVDDEILLKVKVQRWRGAVWCEDQSAVKRTWLISAGVREDGSCDDFYAALEAEAKAARARHPA